MNHNQDQDQEEEAAVAPEAPPAAQVNFALAPALIYSVSIIDYTTAAGAKVYRSAVEPLATKFDCQAENLKVFLNELNDRSTVTGWYDILLVPPDAQSEDIMDVLDLTTSYGQLSLEQVRAHAATYIHRQVRAAQDSMQLYQCLANSLTKEGTAKVMLRKEEYTVRGILSGTCLLKVIISASYIDTNATTTFIRGRLSSLDTYMKSVDSDIEKFNQYVKSQLDSLNARGQTTQDLLANLFKGYEEASDNTFRAYISKKQDDYHDGVEIASDHLMQLALNKYRTLVEGGKWNAPTEADEKIIALEAQLKKLGKGASTGTGKDTPKRKAQGTGKPNKKQARRRNDNRPAWMFEPPKQGEPEKKTVDHKIYNWCPKHEAWGIHAPGDCEGKGLNKFAGKPNLKNKKPGNKPDYKTLKLNKALASVIKQEDEEDDE
jgi:hypothetical protein